MMPPTNSHECHGDPIGGSSRDGKILMIEFTRPGQVPYRCLQSRSMSCISIKDVALGDQTVTMPSWLSAY